MQCTPAYESPLKAVTELLNRTVSEKARAMLLESGIPKTLWNEAVSCDLRAQQIRNKRNK